MQNAAGYSFALRKGVLAKPEPTITSWTDLSSRSLETRALVGWRKVRAGLRNPLGRKGLSWSQICHMPGHQDPMVRRLGVLG